MRRGRQDQFNAGRSSPSRGQGHRGGGAQQQPRANVKRRPCQDIRGPQRLISYQIPNANSDKELGVIRAIIARETALADLLAHVSKYQPTLVTPTNGGSKLNCVTACFGALDQKTTDLLLGMRITSINVAESIQDWRSQLTLPRPFVWQKKNYLQGMGCDVDFLHFDGCVAGILGNGRTKRNPFVTEGRNVDELAQLSWEAGKTPKSVAVSGVDEMRLRLAARMLVEEEMRCGKADHRKPPPTWYIQRKKRMLAMGINLQAGTTAPASSKSSKSKTKSIPKKRKQKQQLLDDTMQETGERSGEQQSSPSSKSPKIKRKKKLLVDAEKQQEVDDDAMMTEEMLVCSGRKRGMGWSRDGRLYVSSAEVWLLPMSVARSTAGTTDATDATDAAPPAFSFSTEQELLDDNEEERMVVRAEISMILPSRNGWCGSHTRSSLVVSIAELRRGGFIPMSSMILGGSSVVVVPPDDSRSKKGKKGKRKKIKGKTNAKIKEKITKKVSKHKARVALGDAGLDFLLDRLVPTVDGVSWEQDGIFMQKSSRKFAPMVGLASSGYRRTKDIQTKHRVSIRLGKFWCAVSSWIAPTSSGGGLELDISTVALSSHSKRLSLDHPVLERLLGPSLILRSSSSSSSSSRPVSRSNTTRPKSRTGSRPGSRSSSRPVSRNSSRPNSRPPSRGAGSRPSSRGPGSRPSSRGATRSKNSSSSSTSTAAYFAELPRLDILTMAVLEQCIVVVETPTGPEFYAQPSATLSNHAASAPSDINSHLIAPEIVAAAHASTEMNASTTTSAGGVFLASGQLSTSTGESTGESSTGDVHSPEDGGDKKVLATKSSVETPTLVPLPSMPSSNASQNTAAVIVPARKERRRPDRFKVLQGATMVGGIYFLVDIHFEKNIYFVDATYPTSGRTISKEVSMSEAIKCTHVVDSEEDSTLSDVQKSQQNILNLKSNELLTGSEEEEQTIRHAKAVLSRLDLDFELPPGLMLRLEDDASNKEEQARPLFALMANPNGVVSPVRGALMASDATRPLSPLLPIFAREFAPKSVEKKNTRASRPVSPNTHQDNKYAALQFLKRLVERAHKESNKAEETLQLSKDASENEKVHRKTLNSVEVVQGSMMRISLIPPSLSS